MSVLGRALGALLLGLFLATPVSAQFTFDRGDANLDASTDIADAIAILDGLFLGGSIPCEDAADVNDDGGVDIADPIALLDYLFASGPAPAAPFGVCGSDPTADALVCATALTCPPDVGANVPIILSSSPAVGRPGTLVTIEGRNFSPVLDENRVLFVDARTGLRLAGLVTAATVDPFVPGVGAPSTLEVLAPSGVRSGSIEIVIAGGSGTVLAAGAGSFVAAPVIRTILVGDFGDQVGIARDLSLNIYPGQLVVVGRNLEGLGANVEISDGIQVVDAPTVTDGVPPSAQYTLFPDLEALTVTVPTGLLPNICTSSRLRFAVETPAGGTVLRSAPYELPYRLLDLGTGALSDVPLHLEGAQVGTGIRAGVVRIDLHAIASTPGDTFEWIAEYRDPADPTGQTWLPLSRVDHPTQVALLVPLIPDGGPLPESTFRTPRQSILWDTLADFPAGTGPVVTAVRVTPSLQQIAGPDPCGTRFFSEDIVIDARATVPTLSGSVIEEFDDANDADPATDALWDDGGSGILTTPLGSGPDESFGTGTQDVLLANGTFLFDTDAATLFDTTSGTAVDLSPGQPGQAFGEFHYRSLRIFATANVEVSGSKPLVIRLGGDGNPNFLAFELSAPLDLSGEDALDASTTGPTTGGPGGPGGGDGGDGAEMGLNLIDLLPDLIAPATRGGLDGGYAGLSSEYRAIFGSSSAPRAGCAGGGGNRERGGDAVNALFGSSSLVPVVRPAVGGPAFGDDAVSVIRGGSGGGGGGAVATFTSTTLSARHGGGGGGGGGAIEVVARGRLRLDAAIDASGGNGGKGSPGQQSGAGGGGAGGTIALRATGDLIVSGAGEALDVAGGFGGIASTSTLNPVRAGDGSPGRVRFETNGILLRGGAADEDSLLPTFGNPPAVSTGFIGAPLPATSGADGSFSAWGLTFGEYFIDTDTGEVDDPFGVLVAQSASGTGTFEFTDFVLPAGVTLFARGTQPLVIRSQGLAEVNGTIDVSGLPGGIPNPVAGIPAAGGIPGAAGGAGGAGGFGTLLSATEGEDGALPPTLPAILINPPPPGPGSPVTFVPVFPARGGDAAVVSVACGGGHGGGAGHATAGTSSNMPFGVGCPVSSSPGGTAYGTASFISGDPANVTGTLTLRVGGAGGAGGGARTDPGVAFYPGTGGGGGGGFVEISAGGELRVTSTGRVLAVGGDSYSGRGASGCGSAGAGGGIRLRSNGRLLVATGSILDVSAGTSGADPVSAGLSPTYVPVPAFGVGNSAVGRIRLESLGGVSIVDEVSPGALLTTSEPFVTAGTSRFVAVGPAVRVEGASGEVPSAVELLPPIVLPAGIPGTTVTRVLVEGAPPSAVDPAQPGNFSPAVGDPSVLEPFEYFRLRVFLHASPTEAPQVESVEVPWGIALP